MKSLPTRMLVFFLAVFCLVSAAWALKPEEVAIIAMEKSKDSRHIAEYYAEARGIPKSHILLLDGKPQKVMKRSTWEKKTRPEIIELLEKNKLTDKIRCLVTCWDVPLRIEPQPSNSPEFQARTKALKKERSVRVAELNGMITTLDSVGRSERPPSKAPLAGSTSEKQLTILFNNAMRGFEQRTQNATSDTDKARVRAFFQQCLIKANGNLGLLQLLGRSKTENQSPEQAKQGVMVLGVIQGLQQSITAMEGLPASVARDQEILDLMQNKAGLFGAIRWIDQRLQLLKKNESGAAFDSELSMIFYADHNALAWRPNYLHYSYDGRRTRKVMMVSRLAAPSVKIVERMIDDAIATEKVGLEGKFYIDSRDVKAVRGQMGTGTFYEYDQSLIALVERLRKHTDLTVVHNDKLELFQPGDCPDTGLYCGWYSVRQYIDAFDWNRGSVGYHLASWEAKWLRKWTKEDNHNEKPWCPYMLKDGVCATLGPVAEPYLMSFPLPDDFFSLLLTGKLTLAEVFYRTKQFNSWNQALIGDPLYTPFKVNPKLDVRNLPERMRGGRAAKRQPAESSPAPSEG